MNAPFQSPSAEHDAAASVDSPARRRVLVLGGSGMLGHRVWKAARSRFDSWMTVRAASPALQQLVHDAPERVITGVDASHPHTLEAAIARVRPHAIVNAIGLIKQRSEADDPVAAIQVNALLPHQLARAAAAAGARLIHISTDCVFSGRAGHYREGDLADATDLYGRSKLLGEVTRPGAVTLRTSMIGRELSRETGLLEWFLTRRDQRAEGFTQAIFSGLTTPVLAALIVDVIDRHPELTGLYHVAAAPIDKHRLLTLLNDAFGARVQLMPSDRLRIDRSLDGSRFQAATGFIAPAWEAMVHELANDPTPYDQWRLSA